MVSKKVFFDYKDIQSITGYSKTKCYSVIREINEYLENKGIKHFQGKVLVNEFNKYYGIEIKEREA